MARSLCSASKGRPPRQASRSAAERLGLCRRANGRWRNRAAGAGVVRRWRQAEQSLRRAIEIGPVFSLSHTLLARFVLWPLGRVAEALREMQTAQRSDPLSPHAHMDLADVLLTMGRFDDAAKQCEQMPADVEFRKECLGRARLGQKRAAEAIRILATSPRNNWGYLAMAYARAGQRVEAKRLMMEAPALFPEKRGTFEFAWASPDWKTWPPSNSWSVWPCWPSPDGFYFEQRGIRVSSRRSAHQGSSE